MNEEDRNALVVRPSAAVEKIGSGAGSVLSRIVSDAIALARSNATASARFRVGNYDFREADYQQILLWAKALDKTPEKIIEALEKTSVSEYRIHRLQDVISFQVKDGSISSLVWDNEILPLTEFVWVNDLKICELAFFPRPGRRSMVQKSKKFWKPAAQAHLKAAKLISQKGPNLKKPPELVAKALASCRAAARLLSQVSSPTPNAPSPTPNYQPSISPDELTIFCRLPTLRRLQLICGENQLTELDLSFVPQLTELYCWGNHLTELDLSSVPQLTKLYCWENQLTALDLSSVPELAELRCANNQLTELDVRQNQKLKVLECDPSVSIKRLPNQVYQNEK
jgi:Leucine-rich repeat (LRR) protein